MKNNSGIIKGIFILVLILGVMVFAGATLVCGNGNLDLNLGEECDDGNLVDNDGCSANCKFESFCGDGIVNVSAGEECDLNESNGVLCSAAYNSNCNYCSDSCKIKTVIGEFCGDGILNETYESCDDGNRISNDRCSNECKKPVEVEDFVPLVWLCDNRIVYDDGTEPGRVSEDGTELIERINNYAFEGEQIQWQVLVMDKNGKEKISDVYATVGPTQGEGNDIEVNCVRLSNEGENNKIDPSCNARILEEEIDEFNPVTMAYYLCTLTVETPESMYGKKWVTVEAEDFDGVLGTMDENEYWFLNPKISLDVTGNIEFEGLREGTSGYSKSLLISNDADMGSGVLLDMFISGTDFYDSANSEAMCPTTNQLALDSFRYYAVNGAYSTDDDQQVDVVLGDVINRNKDVEGYVNIDYGIGFNDPNPFYENMEILQAGPSLGPYYGANVLAPGADIALIFRLDLPEPCNGDFDTGQIYFWGEAV